MPRSFLVKKPCSHRIPNYGQLLEAQTDILASCGSCAGLISLFQNEGSSIPKLDAVGLWDTDGLSQSLSDVRQKPKLESVAPSWQKSESSNELSIVSTALPLKDSVININMPLEKGALDVGSDLSDFNFFQHMFKKRETAQHSESLECSECRQSCIVAPFHKPQDYHGSAHRLFSCQYCAKAYASLGALKMHIRTHTLPCACRICGKAFSRPWLLQGHIRTHTGEKPFSCLHCGRGFADRSNLRAHLQTHSDVKRYQCPGCGKTFSRVSLLAKHRDGCCCPVS
ncbi:zinc finger protein SNAI3 [Bombina bombina]|uniref:zinc finger protein SNAI3 n=1 Tax=Bombina bombina TaxID=8345 RepID=UPI00235B2845|nr:zinc finger protein SNAI3 [Bombina bombina]